MFIKDAIFGNIELTPLEAEIIETPEMQRLRFVSQTGFVYLVYPGATHSRFEHSLGTMNISREIARGMDLKDDEVEILALAGLLHDIGHGPFSHLSEGIFSKYLHTNHEKNGIEIIKKSKIKEIVEDNSFSINEIIKRLEGKDGGEIITAPLGADRLDYLLRDAHYTGVTYGVIDYQQVRSKMALYKKHLAIFLQGLPQAESLLLARYFMFITVYHHHAVEIANKMFERAVEMAIENDELDPKELLYLRDFELISRLMNSESATRLARRLLERKLFKRIVYEDIRKEPNYDENEIERKIEKAGLSRSEFIIAKNRLEFVNEGIPVLDRSGKKLGNLEDYSPIIRSLMENTITRFIIASDRRNAKKIKKALR